MNRRVLLLGIFLLAGCAAPYHVREATDKFSDPAGPAFYTMSGNAIDYRDPLGAIKTSELNAYVMRARTTGKILGVGVDLFIVSTSPSGGNWLTVRVGDDLVFLADGQRIAVKAVSSSIDHSVTGTLGQIYTDRYDYARYPMTVEQLKAIAFAQSIEFKVQGRNGYETFPRTNFKLLDSFMPNLQRFYSEQIEPFL